MATPSPLVEKLLTAYAGGMSITETSRHSGVDISTCLYKIKEAGIFRPVFKPYICDHNFFETIDTEEKAYWLGFITADGNIRDDPKYYELRIQLGKIDTEHLEKFSRAIKTDRKLYLYKDKGRGNPILVVGSKKMVQDLIAKGVMACKSFIVKPYAIAPDLERHYWRGYFDGNGCLMKNYIQAFKLVLTGNEYMINGFKEWCNRYIKPYKIAPNGKIFQYRISSKETVWPITYLMYNDCTVSLDRKQEKADHILSELSKNFNAEIPPVLAAPIFEGVQ